MMRIGIHFIQCSYYLRYLLQASKTLTEALIEKLRPVRSSSANMALEAIQLLAATAKDDNGNLRRCSWSVLKIPPSFDDYSSLQQFPK
jgi:hypothetical protein